MADRAYSQTHNRPDSKGSPVRDMQEGKDRCTKRNSRNFLTPELTPICKQELEADDYNGNKINLITQENYEFLRDSFFRYANLMGKEAEHTPGRTPGEGISRLCGDMESLVGNGIGVNVEQDGGKLFFRLWKYHEWGSLTLYYFPVKFLENLGPKLKRISISFMHGLMLANGISTILEDCDMEYARCCLSDGYPDESSEEKKERMKLIHSYDEGRIYAQLCRVESRCYYKNLPKALEMYEPRNGYERSLVSSMLEGLEFLTPEHGIMEYGYDPFYEEEPDYSPMPLSQQIRIVYDNSDMVTDFLVDHYNASRTETYDIIPATTFDLSPDTAELFSMDDYPERFFKWADNFINLIS